MQAFWILLLTVHLIYSCAAYTTTEKYHELMYGKPLRIRLPSEAIKLEFMSVDKSEREVLWSRSSITKKGIVAGSNSNKEFVLRSVKFEDQGTYTLFDLWSQKISIHLIKIVAERVVQYRVAGESLNIYLNGLPKNDATLKFSNQYLTLTLVAHGSPVGNLHPEYMGRVQVTERDIEVLNVNVSDVGNYTLSDRLNRTIRIISMNLVDHHVGVNAAPFMSLLMLLGIPSCIFCYCRKRCRKSSQPTTTIHTTTTTVNYDNQINPPGPPPAYPVAPTPGYSPGYPAGGESTVHPPPNPTFPPQQPYSGYPATSPAMPPNPGYSPGYPAGGESTLHPPPNPTFPPQQPYSGYPATSPAMPPNSGYNPGYPAGVESTVHPPPNPTFPPQQPYSGYPATSPAMPPNSGFAPVMYNAPVGSEPVKGEIPATTPLLTPSQSEVPQPSAMYTGTNVLNSSDSAVQFNINMGKDSSSNFL